jgi:Acyl dehydratase
MNKFSYEDLQIGLSQEFLTEITQDMMEQFRSITGDINPLHNDKKFAEGKGYDGCVVYGMLVSSFYSTLAGVYLPGERSLIQSIDIKMVKPVFVGDRLTVRGEVQERHDTFKMVRLKCQITNQLGKKGSKAVMQIGVLD